MLHPHCAAPTHHERQMCRDGMHCGEYSMNTSMYGNWLAKKRDFSTTYCGFPFMARRCDDDAVISSGLRVAYIPPGERKSGIPARSSMWGSGGSWMSVHAWHASDVTPVPERYGTCHVQLRALSSTECAYSRLMSRSAWLMVGGSRTCGCNPGHIRVHGVGSHALPLVSNQQCSALE